MTQGWNGVERRQTAREDFVKAVVCAIREEVSFKGLSEEQHLEQHAFIAEWIEETRARRARWEKVKTQVMGWGAVTLLGSIGAGAYNAMLYLREHLK